MKSVLIITRDFTPYCSKTGWMMRAVTMANFLAARECEVTVVAARRSQPAATLELHPAVRVRWVCDVLEHFREDSRSWLRNPARSFSVLVLRGCRVLRIQSIDRTMYSLPWYRKRIRQVMRERNIRNIVVTTPPHSLQTLTTWLRSAYPEANIVSDFRDAWSFRPLHGAKGRVTANEQAMERQALSQVDHALFVSDGMRDLYASKYDIKHSVTVQNGYSDTPTGKADSRFADTVSKYRQAGYIVLGYFGSGAIGIDGHEKDLSIMLRAIESDSWLLKNIAVVIQGVISVSPCFRTKVLCSVFEPADYAIVKAHMASVDLGVNLFNFSLEYAPGVVAGKTYEYICSGLPFIAIVPKTATSVQAIVDDTGAYMADVNDERRIVETLSKVIEDQRSLRVTKRLIIDEDKRRQYSRAHQYEKVLEILI